MDIFLLSRCGLRLPRHFINVETVSGRRTRDPWSLLPSRRLFLMHVLSQPNVQIITKYGIQLRLPAHKREIRPLSALRRDFAQEMRGDAVAPWCEGEAQSHELENFNLFWGISFQDLFQNRTGIKAASVFCIFCMSQCRALRFKYSRVETLRLM